MLYKLGGKKGETFTFKTRKHFSIKVPRNVIHEFKESFFEEVYFQKLPKHNLEVENPVVIDIGANVGYFTAFALAKLKHPKILAYEPIPRNFRELKDNIDPLKQNVTLVNMAVSCRKGDLILKLNNDQNITTSASIFDNPYGQDELVVKTTTLEEIMSEHQLSKIDILKMDCEGAEYEIIYNTPVEVFRNIQCITMETHQGTEPRQNTDSIAGYLKELGYQVHLTHKPSSVWAYKG
jgi:FkbM family methyltransferase